MIASDIGGMAERTAGLCIPFRTPDPAALAEAILSAHSKPEVLRDHKTRITPPLDLTGFVGDGRGWVDWQETEMNSNLWALTNRAVFMTI